MHNRNSLVSIVLPAYNEEKAIGGIIDEIRQTMDNVYNYEIVVVDDCSTDRTGQKVMRLWPPIPT